jgi:hypothetical protein
MPTDYGSGYCLHKYDDKRYYVLGSTTPLKSSPKLGSRELDTEDDRDVEMKD